jgi:Toprim-like
MSARAYRRLIDALEAHGSTGRDHGARAQYHCPSHEDGTPSLSITDAADRVLVCCRAGCDSIDVLEAIGLDWPDLFDERATGKNWNRSTLRKVGARANGDGRVTLGSVRYMPGASNGQIKALAVKGSTRDLWPDPATITGPVIYVVEGEPDAVTAAHIGLPAVGVPGAAKWRPEWGERIAAGRARVVVITDADEPGRNAAQKWAAAIAEHCQDVRVLDLGPGRSDGYDLGDFATDAVTDQDRACAREIIENASEVCARVPRTGNPVNHGVEPNLDLATCHAPRELASGNPRGSRRASSTRASSGPSSSRGSSGS